MLVTSFDGRNKDLRVFEHENTQRSSRLYEEYDKLAVNIHKHKCAKGNI